MVSPRSSRHSKASQRKGALSIDTTKSCSSEDERETPTSVPRRRLRRRLRSTVVASDEDEEEDARCAQGDTTSNDKNEGERSEGASTEQTARMTRLRTLRKKTSRDPNPPSDEDTPKSKIPRKTRSIDVRHMKGDKRVS